MNIYLTFDYELFFGEEPGSVQKCLIEPTESLLKMARVHGIKMVFFVDVGYLVRAKDFSEDFPLLAQEINLVENQLRQMVSEGHDIQLHIHPHWEKSIYEKDRWIIRTDGVYKLNDFSDEEVRSIVVRYKNYLDALIGYKTTCFRAGGWCIQPFSRWKELFCELGLKYDSSVFPGGFFRSPHYEFDFRNAPMKSSYRFDNDVCIEDENGFFTEFPISSWHYSPLFYWRLYIMGRIDPFNHKMLGDGKFLSQPGRKKSVLTSFTWNHVSADGYYASKLKLIHDTFLQQMKSDLVIIGHPKSMTRYSLSKLDQFIDSVKDNSRFTIFKNLN